MKRSLDLASLPACGHVIDPLPEHYARAIRYLEHARHPAKASQRSLCWRLKATLRRLEWTPRRLRQMREAA